MKLKTLKLLLFSLLLLSCAQKGLKFTGNISEPVNLQESSNLYDFLKEQNIAAEYALLSGNDGTAAYVFNNSFQNIDLIRIKQKWHSQSYDLPEVVNINDLSHVSLFVRDHNNSLNILRETGQIDIITPFEAELAQYDFLGKSSKNDHSVRKFKFDRVFKVRSDRDSILVILNNGSEKWLKTGADGHIEEIEFQYTYFSCEDDTVVTLWEDPPGMNAYELHDLIGDKLENEKSLIIFLDSFGWQYMEHLSASKQNTWFSQFNFTPLRVPYPPKTVNTYWAIGSGTPWQKRNSEDQYFVDMMDDNSRGLIVEADRQFYPSPVKHLLQVDENDNGTIDDEIYLKALELIENDLDMLLVHFHSLDDVGHSTGAYSRERLESYFILENYIKQLTENWTGSVYMFSDHGMHTEGNKGTHYNGSAEDILGVWGQLK
jgi:type I phosphodiesterase/nucleotide pyrophosphatase